MQMRDSNDSADNWKSSKSSGIEGSYSTLRTGGGRERNRRQEAVANPTDKHSDGQQVLW